MPAHAAVSQIARLSQKQIHWAGWAPDDECLAFSGWEILGVVVEEIKDYGGVQGPTEHGGSLLLVEENIPQEGTDSRDAVSRLIQG